MDKAVILILPLILYALKQIQCIWCRFGGALA